MYCGTWHMRLSQQQSQCSLCFLALHFILQCQNKWAGHFPKVPVTYFAGTLDFSCVGEAPQGSRKKSSRLPQQQGNNRPHLSRSRGWGPGRQGGGWKTCPSQESQLRFSFGSGRVEYTVKTTCYRSQTWMTLIVFRIFIVRCGGIEEKRLFTLQKTSPTPHYISITKHLGRKCNTPHSIFVRKKGERKWTS